MGNVYVVKSTGDLLTDALCCLGIFELALKVDPFIKGSCTLGRAEILRLKTEITKQDFEVKLLGELMELSRDPAIQDILSFRVNTGRRDKKFVPAHEILANSVKKIIGGLKEESFKPLLKAKKKDLETFYMSINPIYGKGLRKYDKAMDGLSEAGTPEIITAYLVGLALHTIKWEEREEKTTKRVHLLVTPPIGSEVNENYLKALRRLSILYSTEDAYAYFRSLENVPRSVLPVVVLAYFDFSLLSVMSNIPPHLMVFDVEEERGGGQASRLYKSFSTNAFFSFFMRLGADVHEVKEYIKSLVRARRRNEARSLIDSILIDLSGAIANGDAMRFNKALYASFSIEERLKEDLKKYVKLEKLRSKVAGKAVACLLRT